MSILIALALISAEPSTVVQASQDNGTASQIDEKSNPNSARVDQAWELIGAGKQTEAVALLDEVIASEEAQHKDASQQYYSARSMVEAIMYSGIAATQKKSATVLDDSWAYAYFAKGFALIDLGRHDEAKAYFDKALALSPMNSQMLGERGEWHKSRKAWSEAFADFAAADSAAEFSPDERKNPERARALRGMGFVRIEQGELKEAEKLFRQSLKLEPGNSNALSELEYIKSLQTN